MLILECYLCKAYQHSMEDIQLSDMYEKEEGECMGIHLFSHFIGKRPISLIVFTLKGKNATI